MFIACDSSRERQKEDQYIVVGSLWLPKNQVGEHTKKLIDLRVTRHCWGEVRWNKTLDSRHADFYKEFIRLGISEFVEFKTIIVRRDERAIRLIHGGNIGKLLAKFHYQLISRHAKQFPNNTSFQIILDSDEELQQETVELKDFLEQGSFNKTTGTIENIASANSHILPAIQLCDLLTGAVAASWNRVRADAQHTQLILLIEEIFGKKLNQQTSALEKRLNIWRHWPLCRVCNKLIINEIGEIKEIQKSGYFYSHKACTSSVDTS